MDPSSNIISSSSILGPKSFTPPTKWEEFTDEKPFKVANTSTTTGVYDHVKSESIEPGEYPSVRPATRRTPARLGLTQPRDPNNPVYTPGRIPTRLRLTQPQKPVTVALSQPRPPIEVTLHQPRIPTEFPARMPVSRSFLYSMYSLSQQQADSC